MKTGLSFSAARPSDPTLWDVVVEPGRGATPNTVSVVCSRKASITQKRSVHCMYCGYYIHHVSVFTSPFQTCFLCASAFLIVLVVSFGLAYERCRRHPPCLPATLANGSDQVAFKKKRLFSVTLL